MNLNTYKVHALGDYVETIRRYGTCDSYTTETVGGNAYMYQDPGEFILHFRVN